MDNDTELDFNETVPEYGAYYEIQLALMETMFALSFLCLSAAIFLLCAILKYKRLRTKPRNRIIMHWSICNIIICAILPFYIRTNIDLYFHHHVWRVIEMLLEQLQYTSVVGVALFTALLTQHWYLEKHNAAAVLKMERQLTFFIIFIHTIQLFAFSLDMMGLVRGYFAFFTAILVFLSFLVHFLYTVIVLVTDLIKTKLNPSVRSNKKNVSAWLTNIFFLSYFPIIAGLFLGPFFIVYHVYHLFALLLAMCNPIWNVVILYCFDRDFHVFIRHMVRGNCFKYGDELDEDQVVYSNEQRTNQSSTP